MGWKHRALFHNVHLLRDIDRLRRVSIALIRRSHRQRISLESIPLPTQRRTGNRISRKVSTGNSLVYSTAKIDGWNRNANPSVIPSGNRSSTICANVHLSFVRKCIEEARRANERSTRRVTTTQEQTSDTDKDEQDNEAERSNTQSRVFTPVTRRRLARSIKWDISSIFCTFSMFFSFSSIEKNFDSTRRNLVPAPSALKRRIPSFLRVYSRASPSNDVLLQWHLFHLSELEAFCAMMSRLYKNENLARVQFYEIYRSALLDTLASKRSLDVGPALNWSSLRSPFLVGFSISRLKCIRSRPFFKLILMFTSLTRNARRSSRLSGPWSTMDGKGFTSSPISISPWRCTKKTDASCRRPSVWSNRMNMSQ